MPGVRLLVPIKPLDAAKSRLRPATPDGTDAHRELALALALDTVAAAVTADGVERIVVVTADRRVAAAAAALGADVLPDGPADGLNAALRHAAGLLRAADPAARVGALQADLPSLRPAELSAALRAAGPRRAFCADRHGTGTTLLVAAAGAELDPRFGPDSAARHGVDALALTGEWPSLRCDVDTVEDLREAAILGTGPRTTDLLAARQH